MTQGRIPVTPGMRGVISHLIMLREQHNIENPQAPIFQRDIAEYVGLRSKSTLSHYESGKTAPSLTILCKWLEFWGEGLFCGPLGEEEAEGETDNS